LEVDSLVTVSVSELKAKLSEHLRRVKAGEEVLVTDRGRAVAVLRPPPKAAADEARRQRLADQGVLKVGRGVSKEFHALPIGEDPEGLVREALLAEREEGP
jgi:prevent-host-death family protein